MHWHASLLRLFVFWTLAIDGARRTNAAPATYIVPVARASRAPERHVLTSASDAIRDCLNRQSHSHGALLVYADNDVEDGESEDGGGPFHRTFLVHNGNDGNSSDDDDDDDVQPVALVPRTVEPLGLTGSVGRTFKHMPFSQRMAVFSTFAGALSVPAYLYNAAQGFDEEEIARLKAEALMAQTANGNSKNGSAATSGEHAEHGHIHEERQSSIMKPKKSSGTYRHKSSGAKMPGRAMPVYAVRPRDIAVPRGKDVNIVINFEPMPSNHSVAVDSSTGEKLAARGLASVEEASVVENALKKRPHGPKRKVLVAQTITSSAKPPKVPNETVGKLLDATGMSTAVLYTLAALNSMWRAAIIPDSDLKKYRRDISDFGDDGVISTDTALVCLPFQRHSGGVLFADDFEAYDMPGYDASYLVRRDQQQQEGFMAKRGLASKTLMETAGKHAKTLGIGGIGVTWGYMMHSMGQRRDLIGQSTTDKAETLAKRSQLTEVQSQSDGSLVKRWTPGRGSILFAGVLAGTGLAKAGLGVPELHPTVVEEEGPKRRNESGQTNDLQRRGVATSPTMWSTIHRGLNDKVTIALGSMAASALAVKSGLAGDIVSAFKKPFVKTNKTQPATGKADATDAVAEKSCEECVEKRQLGRGVTAAVGGFTGLYLAQHLGSSGQERENKLYKQQLGLQRREEPALTRRGFEIGSSSGGSLKALEEVLSGTHVAPPPPHLYHSTSLAKNLKDVSHARSSTAPGFILYRSLSRPVSGETYLDGSPRGRSGYEQAKAKKPRGASQAPTTRWVPVQSSDRARTNPDLIAEINVRHHHIDKAAPRVMHSKAKILAAGFGGTAAGAFLHRAYAQATQQEAEAQKVAATQAVKKASMKNPVWHRPTRKDNGTLAAMPDDVLSKTQKKSQTAIPRGNKSLKKPGVSKAMLRPVSTEEIKAPFLERGVLTRNTTTVLHKRGSFNTAVFGALVGTTGAAALYSWKHDDPGTRKVRHVPAGFLENATETEMAEPPATRRSISNDVHKRSLYTSLAKMGTKVAKSLPAWMKTSKAKGAGAIAGGLTLSTTAALLDDGPKEQKKKPAVFKENATAEAENVFTNASNDKNIAAIAKRSSSAEPDLERRANLLTPFKALKQLHADVVLRHGKTAGNAMVVGGVAATAGATGLLKRQEDEGADDDELDTELDKRGAFGKNVFKMIDVASLAVPAGAIVGALGSKAVHAVAGKGGKAEAAAAKRSEPAFEGEEMQKRKVLGMSNLGAASLATMGGGLIASPIKSLFKGLKGGSKSAAKGAEAAAVAAKRDVYEGDVEDRWLAKRGAPAEAALQAVKKPQTKVLGMSLLSAASMSTMFGFLIAPPIKNAWKKHKKAKEEAAAALQGSTKPFGAGKLARRATIKVKVPDYSDFLDEMLIETHRKKPLRKRQINDDELSSRSLQQTIDYKFGKDGGEFKVSFSPLKGDDNKTETPETMPKMKSKSNNAAPLADNSTNTDPEEGEIAMPLNDTLATPHTIKIHAHKDAAIGGPKHNASPENDKAVDISLHKRCVGKEGKPKGRHPSIEAHRQLKEELAMNAKRNMTPDSEGSSATPSTDAEKDKIEYDVNKDGAHFEATFVARQPQEGAESPPSQVEKMKDTAKSHAIPSAVSKHPSKEPGKAAVVAPYSSAKDDTKSDAKSPTCSTCSNESSGAKTVPKSASESGSAAGAAHLESVENTVKTDPTGVTTVTTRIAPARKRSLRADR